MALTLSDKETIPDDEIEQQNNRSCLEQFTDQRCRDLLVPAPRFKKAVGPAMTLFVSVLRDALRVDRLRGITHEEFLIVPAMVDKNSDRIS